MKTFAFLTHPRDVKELRSTWPFTRFLPDFAVNSFLRNIPPFKVSKIKNIRSAKAEEINGYLIHFPLLSNQITGLKEQAILDKIIAAADIAHKLDAGILGLGGLLAERGYDNVKKFKLPVTNGAFFTGWSIIEAVHRIAKIKKIDLKNAIITVIGASSAVGSLCSRKLAHYVSKIIISGGERKDLERLVERIELDKIEWSGRTAGITIEQNKQMSVKESGVVIIANTLQAGLFDTKDLKSGTVVCDVSLVNNIETGANLRLRKDITIIDGGLVKLPYPTQFSFHAGLPRGVISAALAETMLLTFEERFMSYSLGSTNNIDKLEEIANIAVKHGFEVWVPEAPVL